MNRRYSVRMCSHCRGLVAHWIVKGPGLYEETLTFAEALEVVGQAEARRLAEFLWWLDEVHPRRVVLQRHGSAVRHPFPSPGPGPSTSWQQAALFLEYLERAGRVVAEVAS